LLNSVSFGLKLEYAANDWQVAICGGRQIIAGVPQHISYLLASLSALQKVHTFVSGNILWQHATKKGLKSSRERDAAKRGGATFCPQTKGKLYKYLLII